MSIRIIADSACDIVGNTNRYLKVVPLPIMFGDEQYLDGVTLSHMEFYEKLVSSAVVPTTSQVPPHDFENAIRETLDAGDTPIVLTVSSKLSGTYNSARIAASEFDEKVYLVDSENVCLGEKVLVQYAVRLAEEGKGAEEIVAELDKRKKKIRLIALLDTLKYLRKSGRISHITGIAGDILSIKPLVSIQNGAIELAGKARGLRNANKLLTQLIVKEGGIDFSMPYALGFTGAADNLLQKYIEESKEIWKEKISKLPIGTIGGPIATHAGPGAIGVAFFAP
ncbi:MAG: DegV family protein [Tyzzerella sp.]|nr:DegV family protein [Tyzzerella sp.]